MQKIKNIIFDYGNVIFDIDFKITQNALAQLGITEVESFFGHQGHHAIFDDLEVGKISAAEFRAAIREIANRPELQDEKIDAVWNSLLLGTHAQNHALLLDLKSKYRTFLLSNNNEIHLAWIMEHLKQVFNVHGFEDFFEVAYFSHLMKMRKPNIEIFEYVLDKHQLLAEETLFIDDSPQHLKTAEKLGMQTLLMTEKPENLKAFLLSKGIS